MDGKRVLEPPGDPLGLCLHDRRCRTLAKLRVTLGSNGKLPPSSIPSTIPAPDMTSLGFIEPFGHPLCRGVDVEALFFIYLPFSHSAAAATMGSIDQTLPKMAKRYVVKQAKTREELDRIMDVIWAANYTPYEPLVQLVFPVLGFLPSHREASVAESKERFWKNHQQDPSSNWYFAEDLETGLPVGCAQWQVFTSNPFSGQQQKLEAPWWPEGEHREYCESILNQVYKPRVTWMTRPHLALNWMAVHPSHRRRGIATLLMQIGTSRADSLNVETWLESSLMGEPLYSKHNFRPLFKMEFEIEKKDAGDVWRKCAYEMRMKPLCPMWRPKQGDWKEVDSKLGVKMPWELGIDNREAIVVDRSGDTATAVLPPAGAINVHDVAGEEG